MFKVIYKFADLQDNKTVYKVGDTYPRKGYEPTEKRIAELLGKRNKIGKKLIEEIKEKKVEKKPESPKKKADK